VTSNSQPSKKIEEKDKGAPGRPRRRIRAQKVFSRENFITSFFVFMGLVSVIIMSLIVIFLFHEGGAIFKSISLKEFLLGRLWYPTYEPPYFGILPLIAGSLAVTLISSLMAIPAGVATAVYLAGVAGDRVRELVKPAVELLASLPSVILGLFGMVVIAPFMQNLLDLPTGLNILSASIILAIMAIPTITSISEDALHAVPRDMLEASYALGATRWETICGVQIPWALSGISTSVILGMSRAMGETMVVLMVAGGAAVIPTSIFDSVRPMPASIAAEMGEAAYGSEHYYALFAIGIVLFFMTLAFNLLSAWISARYRQKGAATL
jgi:phosphate transport system permease protein